MLPDQYRFTIENKTGVTIDASLITIQYRGKYFSAGVLTYESESSDVANQGSTITDTSFNNGTTVDNGVKSNPCIEMDVHIAANLSTNTATPNGHIIIYLQRATADTAVFTEDGDGANSDIIGVIYFDNAKADKDLVVTVG
jgi:hypothetical protein